MTGEPLVSVAMPIYNAAASLPAALDLIRRQTYANLEILLCDNASTDATPEICAAAAKEDPRIRYFRHPQNLGPQANFNFGLAQKTGEFFMWAAHDDEKAPEFVSETLAALRDDPSAAMACTWTVIVTPEGERVHVPYSPAIASPDLAERLRAFVADPQCVSFYGLYRSSVVDAIGPPDVWLDNDRRYLFLAAIRGPFVVVPKPLFRFRMNHTPEDYSGMGFRMRPGAADYDLDLYRHFPRLLAEAGVRGDDYTRAVAAMRGTLRQYFENRSAWLISRVLSDSRPRGVKVRELSAFARQYPPMLRNRMFWGALRRVVLP
ncbi:MAG TPA: glycosyltransferase family 2 protein [Thermoanaerobaculia bacterium]